MADNTTINTMSGGDVIATDDIAGVKVQRVKVQHGADGSATDVSAASPLPVDGSAVTQPVSAGSLPLPSGAATAAKQPALGAAGSASTDVITVQGIASGTVVPVSDGGGSLTVDDGAGSLTVDGAVAATQSGTWTVQPGNTANTTAWKVDGSAVTQPVSGTVTSNAGTGTRTVAGDVAAGSTDSGNPVKVGGKHNATPPTYTDGQRGDVQLGARGSQRMMMVDDVTGTLSAVVSGSTDAATHFTGLVVQNQAKLWNGASWDRERTPAIFKTATATASGDTALWTPTSSKKFRLMGYEIQVTQDAATSGGAAIDVVLRDATTALGFGFSFYAPSAAGTTFGPGAGSGWRTLWNGHLSAAANNVLNVNLSATLTAGKVRVVVAGTEE